MARKKYYAVARGYRTGVFTTWEECRASTSGYHGAVHKGFMTLAEANEWLAAQSGPPVAARNSPAFDDGLDDVLLSHVSHEEEEMTAAEAAAEYLRAIGQPPIPSQAPPPYEPFNGGPVGPPTTLDLPPPYSSQPATTLESARTGRTTFDRHNGQPLQVAIPTVAALSAAAAGPSSAGPSSAGPTRAPPAPAPPPPPLSEEQQAALDLVLAGENIFLTGPGGTGKSFLIERICQELEMQIAPIPNGQAANPALPQQRKVVHRTATTGIAAINIRGMTIHSWAGLDKGLEDASFLSGRLCNTNMRPKAYKRWLECDVLILDEISMFSDQLLDLLDELGRRVRSRMQQGESPPGIDLKPHEKRIQSFNPDLPFGGLQLVLAGDFYQLPPVDISKWKPGFMQELAQGQGTHRLRASLQYRPKYAFAGKAWRDLRPRTVELTKVFRQADEAFVRVLEKIREGTVTPEARAALSARQMMPPADVGDKIFKLFPLNKDADNENNLRYGALPGPDVIYSARDGQTPESEEYFKLLKDLTCAEEFRVRVGARVMLLHNLDTASGLVNGQTGVVVAFQFPSGRAHQTKLNAIQLGTAEEDKILRAAYDNWYKMNAVDAAAPPTPMSPRSAAHGKPAPPPPPAPRPSGRPLPVVQWDNGQRGLVEPYHWRVDDSHAHLKAWRIQLPLRLAWAFSVHKSQGMSLDSVQVDIKNCFSEGMAYVALSRCRRLESLYIPTGFDASKVRASREVHGFYHSIRSRGRGAAPPLPATQSSTQPPQSNRRDFSSSSPGFGKHTSSTPPSAPVRDPGSPARHAGGPSSDSSDVQSVAVWNGSGWEAPGLQRSSRTSTVPLVDRRPVPQPSYGHAQAHPPANASHSAAKPASAPRVHSRSAPAQPVEVISVSSDTDSSQQERREGASAPPAAGPSRGVASGASLYGRAPGLSTGSQARAGTAAPIAGPAGSQGASQGRPIRLAYTYTLSSDSEDEMDEDSDSTPRPLKRGHEESSPDPASSYLRSLSSLRASLGRAVSSSPRSQETPRKKRKT